MDIKIELTPEKVEQEVVQAIINSGIGKYVADSIQRVLPNLTSTYRNSLDEYVRNAVARYIQEIVNGEYLDVIKMAVRAKLTPEVVEKLVQESISNLRVGQSY